MQIYNTLTHKKEEFIPINKDQVNMYVCGITAYDYCHIGHARSAVVFDILVRHLRNKGLKVNFIRNFTDIDDKIIARAQRENRDWKEIAMTYMKAFHEDMDKLNILRADNEPKATEYIKEIIELCNDLISKETAYSTKSGDVYFRVRKLSEYGKLSGRSLDEMQAGARVLPGEEKEDPLDFALWKGAKKNEPYWESPWGKGRPGWHIECSAMSKPYIPLDIHGGGQDLIFPHHENEIAQSESSCNCQLAKYWIHNGFVQVNNEKMAKSLGNFKTIRDILENFLPETLRFFLLSKHYRSPIDFSTESMEEAEKAIHRIYSCLFEVKKIISNEQKNNSELDKTILEEWEKLKNTVSKALDDDLNTAEALGHIFSKVRLINRILDNKKWKLSAQGHTIFNEFLSDSKNWVNELGLFNENPDNFLKLLKQIRIQRKKIDTKHIEELLISRKTAREKKDFSTSDAIRDELHKSGIQVKDTPEGQTWDFI